MKRLILLNVLLLLIASATAQEAQPQPTPKILRVYDWSDLARQQTLPGEVVSVDGMPILKIVYTNDKAQEISILKISDPTIIRKADFLYGEMKNEFVYSSDRELKLLSSIPAAVPGGIEFTKNQHLSLGIPYRWIPYRFVIIRDKALNGAPILPTQLEVRLSLTGQGPGTVYLRPIKIYGMTDSWWSPGQSGLIGGIGGSVIGCFGALIGLLASKGKARNFVLTSIKISIVVGILLMIAGFIAVVSNQPYAVWYALLLPGVILTLVFSLTLPSIQRRYDELEIRRMTSVDTMGS